MRVEQIMRHHVVSCRESDALSRVAQLMWEHDCGSVPVVDADHCVVGMITDRDICMAAYTQGRALADLRADGAMSQTVCACHPQDRVADAERMMRANQVHRLPVIDAGGHLKGILSLNDVAREAGREHGARKRDVTYAEVGETLDAVCRPRGPRSICVVAA